MSIEQIVSLANSYVGYLGKKSVDELYDYKENANGKYNMFAYELDQVNGFYNGKKNGYDWCAVFVHWLFYKQFGKANTMNMLYLLDNSLGAGVKYAAQYYKQNNSFYDSPEVGDQIFFGTSNTWNHTGIVINVENGFVSTVEGNAKASFDGITYDSAVARFRYPLNYDYIIGYGRPNWSVVEQSETKDFTQEQFDAMMNDWLSRHSMNVSIVDK